MQEEEGGRSDDDDDGGGKDDGYYDDASAAQVPPPYKPKAPERSPAPAVFKAWRQETYGTMMMQVVGVMYFVLLCNSMRPACTVYRKRKIETPLF